MTLFSATAYGFKPRLSPELKALVKADFYFKITLGKAWGFSYNNFKMGL